MMNRSAQSGWSARAQEGGVVGNLNHQGHPLRSLRQRLVADSQGRVPCPRIRLTNGTWYGILDSWIGSCTAYRTEANTTSLEQGVFFRFDCCCSTAPSSSPADRRRGCTPERGRGTDLCPPTYPFNERERGWPDPVRGRPQREWSGALPNLTR